MNSKDQKSTAKTAVKENPRAKAKMDKVNKEVADVIKKYGISGTDKKTLKSIYGI